MRELIRGISLYLFALFAGAVVHAQESTQEPDFVRVDLRVIATGSGADVIVDRGSSDKLAVGDTVFFYPRGGAAQTGKVSSLEERSAVVRLGSANQVPIGTRAEVVIPTSRYREVDEPTSTPKNELAVPEHPPWENKDEDWTPDKPLLAEIAAIRPQDRRMVVTGRVYWIADGTYTTEPGRQHSFTRIGTDVNYLNPFGKGGGLHVDAEGNYRTTETPDQAAERAFLTRLDRFSYSRGGDRFIPNRSEIGRFLQYGMPEFGVLDGAEYGRRLPDGEYTGWSIGFMPEPDEEYQTGEDFQIAFNRRWKLDDFEGLTVEGGYQKTFHEGSADRDLFVTKVVRLPRDGWDFYGTAWVDVYSSGDNVKGSGVEVTQLHLSTNRSYADGTLLGFTYSSFRFPKVDRNEYTTVNDTELADGVSQRFWIDCSKPCSKDSRYVGRVGTWKDEFETGADFEAGLEVDDWCFERSLTRTTLFGTNGRFSNVTGLRFEYSAYSDNGSWDFFTEASRREQDDFSGELDELPLYRLRVTRGLRTDSGWDVDLYTEVASYQEESAVSMGLFAQRSF